MNVMKKTKDARIELQIESEVKRVLTALAKQEGISANELIRRAIRNEIIKKLARSVPV